MRRNHLVLFTERYPFGTGETFVGLEVPYLAEAFDRVTIVPRKGGGSPRAVPDNVDVDARALDGTLRRFRPGLSALLGPTVAELRAMPLNGAPHQRMRRLLRFVRTADGIVRWMRAASLDPRRTLFYSYWLEAVPVGLAACRRLDAALVYVARAAGWDVYEDRYDPPWFPFRTFAAGHAARIFAVSEHAAQHLVRRVEGAPVEVAPLGVEDRGEGRASSDGVYRIASCSAVIPLKRVDLIAEAVAEAARRHPARRFEWTHVGDGPALARLAVEYPPNLKVRLQGHLPYAAVLARYRAEPVDVFVHASTWEGRSVAIMEALNAGIPVVATDAGATRELVCDAVGALVPVRVSAGDLATAITAERGGEVRWRARERWRRECDSKVRFPEFCRRLRAVADQPPSSGTPRAGATG